MVTTGCTGVLRLARATRATLWMKERGEESVAEPPYGFFTAMVWIWSRGINSVG
jgi:hypothetical protein